MTMRNAAAVLMLALSLAGCSWLFGEEAEPLPVESVERAAVVGLYHGYQSSAMWEIREVEVTAVTPVVPTKGFVQEHDPKEIYCVCLNYEARYKVPWTTKDQSDWFPYVRNILVMRTRSDEFIALKPLSICPAYCE